MSFQRDGRNGPITFECDNCQGDHDTGEDDFREALAQAKSEGWWIKKIGDEWKHFCSRDCFKEAEG